MVTKSGSRFGCVSLIILLVGFGLGAVAPLLLEKHSRKEADKGRLDGSPPIRPVFLREAQGCPATSNEAADLDSKMLEVGRSLAASDPTGQSPANSYVVSYFAWHWRISGARRCPPPDQIVQQLAPLLDRYKWPLANTELNDLRLAERLPPSASRAEGLATIGFLRWIPPSALKGDDSRPYARQLLAEQGRFALPWREAAFREISGETRLGTSAAYLAVATDPVGALPKVQRTMADMLRRSRARYTQAFRTGGEIQAIKNDDANRLIELGYALARGGAAAEPYSQPIVEMLDEVIARAAPPFGLMATKPTELCRIAKHIGGQVARAANSKDFCANGFKGGDGAPLPY
ncbi:hypothetical protein [Sphingopyxis lindanitolerans]|uniref:hypothetical protein n=1 Tax=Sphingopyxis lindanitolerans TaxID=2054227 RepID=UPI0011B26CD7|nr:hypothetical protein [Sphingopyxis lindanitolerans]